MTGAMMTKRAQQPGTGIDDAISGFLDEERPHLEVKRRREPEVVAAVIAFLCGDRAGFVNGSHYRVDAGSVATL
jgi:3-oxoacyl-[acyl-carrier protein] reductase